MREIIPTKILLGSVKEPVDANIVVGVTVEEMEKADEIWQPFLIMAVEKAKKLGVAEKDLPQHKHWEWRLKGNDTLDRQSFGIECSGQMQGLMTLSYGLCSRHKDCPGTEIVYVNYVGVAPWNYKKLVPEPRFRTVGRILLQVAVLQSFEKGCEGRLGLHSLEQSESYYRDECRMDDLGIDSTENMLYFEMTSERAQVFAAGG